MRGFFNEVGVRRAVVVGFVGSLLIAITSTMRGFPFPSLTAAPWLFQLNGTSVVERYSFVAVFYIGVAAMCWAWVHVVKLARAGDMSPKAVLATFALWSVALFVGPPLFSGDVYVYFVDGDVLLRGFNPYTSGISALGVTPEVHMIHPLWRSTMSMYGPIFMRIAEGVVWITGGNITAGVFLLRAIVVGAVLGMGAGAVSLAKRFGRSPAEALALALLNPVTVLHLVGGAHNDGIMLGCLVGAFAIGLAAKSWPMRAAAIALCVAGMAVKVPGFAGVLVLGWIWAGTGSWVRRVAGAAIAGVVGLVMFELVTLAMGLGWGWTNALSVPGLARPLLAPANAVGVALGGLFGVPIGTTNVVRLFATVLSVVLGVALVAGAGKDADARAVVRGTGWALLLLAWLGPAVYPWYLTWGLALLGIAGAQKLQTVTMGISVAVAFLIAPGGYGVLDFVTGWERTVVAWITFAVMAWAMRSALVTAAKERGQSVRNFLTPSRTRRFVLSTAREA